MGIVKRANTRNEKEQRHRGTREEGRKKRKFDQSERGEGKAGDIEELRTCKVGERRSEYNKQRVRRVRANAYGKRLERGRDERENPDHMDVEMASVFYLADSDEDEDGQDMPGLLDVSRACDQYYPVENIRRSVQLFSEFVTPDFSRSQMVRDRGSESQISGLDTRFTEVRDDSDKARTSGSQACSGQESRTPRHAFIIIRQRNPGEKYHSRVVEDEHGEGINSRRIGGGRSPVPLFLAGLTSIARGGELWLRPDYARARYGTTGPLAAGHYSPKNPETSTAEEYIISSADGVRFIGEVVLKMSDPMQCPVLFFSPVTVYGGDN
ncbi:hypothetical protein K438DRAFT_1776094 [Mycena galopus ATCC 62051]|nr:hypothetical protein K438DRAFT_1776094 [Mycena galopus ATCC 62051]